LFQKEAILDMTKIFPRPAHARDATPYAVMAVRRSLFATLSETDETEERKFNIIVKQVTLCSRQKEILSSYKSTKFKI
jgi:hypothetical protein